MKTILVIGASRGIGLEAVRQGLEAGYHVRALARSAGEIAIDHKELEKIAASALDAEALKSALAGADAVISTLGMAPTFEPVRLFSDAARVLVAAMKEAGVTRLIAVSGIGAGDSRGVGGALYAKFFQPLLLGPIYEDKDREEEIIRASGLEWTIVRPGFLTRFPKTGRYQVLRTPQEWKGGFITRGDAAAFLVSLVEDATYVGETPLVIG